MSDKNDAMSPGFEHYQEYMTPAKRVAFYKGLVATGQMNQATWDRLMPSVRELVRDRSGLSHQLMGLEGVRVEVLDDLAISKPRRFIVGRSTGWKPIHLELHNRRSRGGDPASKVYYSVRVIEKVR